MTHERLAVGEVDDGDDEAPPVNTASMPVALGPDDLPPLMPPVYFAIPNGADEA